MGDKPFTQFPVKGDQGGIEPVEHQAEDGEKRAEADQPDLVVPNGARDEYKRQDDADADFKQVPQPPTAGQVFPLVVMGHADQFDREIGGQPHAGAPGEGDRELVYILHEVVVAAPCHRLFDDAADHDHHAKPGRHG